MAKKKNRKTRVPRKHCGNTMTTAGRRSFIIGALRRARWPARFMCLKGAEVGKKINKSSGRLAMHYACAECGGEFPAKKVAVDHIFPIIPVTGFDSFDAVILRLFCEPEGLQCLCRDTCHAEKTDQENKLRRENRLNEQN